jgi:hypothetical protein
VEGCPRPEAAGAVAAVEGAGDLDRTAIRAQAVTRFGVARMIREYLDAYASAVCATLAERVDLAGTPPRL